MELGSKIGSIRQGARNRMLASRVDHAQNENDELKVRNQMLRDELERDRTDRQRVLDLLEKASLSVQAPTKRRGRFLRLLIAAGAAYVFGAKAGRERYEQIKGWWSTLMRRPEVVDLRERGIDAARKATGAVDQAITETAR